MPSLRDSLPHCQVGVAAEGGFLRSRPGSHPRRSSTLDLDPLPKSMLGLNELLELRRRRCLWPLGSDGCSPECRANRFKMSVKDITPVSRPDMPVAPDTAGNAAFNAGEAGVEP